MTVRAATEASPSRLVRRRALFSWPHTAIPGFGLTLGVTLAWLGILVLLPLATLLARPWELGLDGFWAFITSPVAVASLRLSFGAALLAALIDVPIGLLIAWVLVRYRFPGRRIADAIIDLPFALPTAVAGIALTTLYGPNGWVGGLFDSLGIQLSNNRTGIVLALMFVGLPFIVRTLEPVMMDLSADVEEAAATLGASRWQTFRRIILPVLTPTLVSGFTLAFARTVGEYGSVIFIAGNIPLVSQIAPRLIVVQVEQHRYAAAAALGLTMLLLSFCLLLLLGLFRKRLRRWGER